MKIIPLAPEEQALTGMKVKAIVTNADIPDGNSGAAVAVKIFARGSGQMPAGAVIWRAAWQIVTPFEGGSISAMTASVGDGNSATSIIAAASVLKTDTPITYKAAQPSVTYTAASDIKVTFTPTGDKAINATAGELHVYLGFDVLPDLALVK